ncbi:MAG: Endoribonuclease [Chloroflexi bacterium]|jgi:enamine deaminase RidA (YjgF/YER057c/UK114 family)|nr:Endoribonuclease [Chloroflexota bacterium]
MELKTYKCYTGKKLMPWGKATVVKNAKGLVFLGGVTAGTEEYDVRSPDYLDKKMVVQDPGAQWRNVLEKIKAYLEELGTSLDNIIKMTLYVKGPFPNGVARSPNNRMDVLDAFFREHCPRLASDNNPPPSELIGIAGLAHPDMIVEIVVVAALPD